MIKFKSLQDLIDFVKSIEKQFPVKIIGENKLIKHGVNIFDANAESFKVAVFSPIGTLYFSTFKFLNDNEELEQTRLLYESLKPISAKFDLNQSVITINEINLS